MFFERYESAKKKSDISDVSKEVKFVVGRIDTDTVKLISPECNQLVISTKLLPKKIETGTFINLKFTCEAEKTELELEKFKNLQEEVYKKFYNKPEEPKLSAYAITQTTLILKWEPLNLGPVELYRIKVYRDGIEVMSNLNLALNYVKITGLSMGTSYDLRIAIITSAGIYESNKVSATTLTMEDLRGLNICFGNVEEKELDELKEIVSNISASYSEDLNVATTHLVASVPEGNLYEEAKNMQIPIVTPGFLKACALKNKVQPSSSFTLIHPDSPNNAPTASSP